MSVNMAGVRNELSDWFRSSGLQIVIIVSVSLWLLRVLNTGARYVGKRMRRRYEDDVSSRTREALIQAARYGLSIATGTVAVLLILSRFSIPLGSLIPVATVAGTGLGFGAQRVVGDFLAGFFLVTERQFGVGDMIKISAVGSETGIIGVVEEVTLRVTRIRRLNGDVVIFPNSVLQQVSNMSRDWSRVLVEVPVPLATDVERVSDAIDEIGRDLYDEEYWRPMILERPQVAGVEEFAEGAVRLRVIGRTLPGKQWDVERELRRRIAMSTGYTSDSAASETAVAPLAAGESSADEAPGSESSTTAGSSGANDASSGASDHDQNGAGKR